MSEDYPERSILSRRHFLEGAGATSIAMGWTASSYARINAQTIEFESVS